MSDTSKNVFQDLHERRSAIDAELREQPDAASRGKVLVVDDDQDILDILRLALGEHYQIQTVKNGLDALNTAVAWSPDLIILDWMLPKLAGHQLLKMLQANAQLRHVPVIFITAKNTPGARMTAQKLGVREFFAKPFDPKQILAKARELLPQFEPRP